MASQETLLELSELDGDWEVWIKNVIQTKDYAATVKSFEELLSILPEDMNIWREYLDYLKNFQKPEILEVYARCCHMFMEETYFWQDYLFQLERFGQEWQKLLDVFKEAIEYTEDPESSAALYRTIIYAKGRYLRLDSIGKNEIDYSSVGELFSNAYTFLKDKYNEYWDPNCSFTKNYAFFAFYRLKDVELGRKLWKEILASGVANKAKWWVEAAELERRFGTIEAARTLLYRAINSVFENYEPLFDYFVQFERDEGNFEQVNRALKKINDQMARIMESKEKQKKNVSKSRPQQSDKNYNKKNQVDISQLDISPTKGKKRPAPSTNGSESAFKHSKPTEPEVLKDKDGFVIPQIPVRLSPRSGESSPTPPINSKSVLLNNVENEKSKENPVVAGVIVDPEKTVFVSNLDFGVSDSDISIFFPGNSGVRLLSRPGTNVSKGYGYVDFPTVEAAQDALKQDRTPLKGRPVFVSSYNPHEKGEHAAFRYSTDIERNKLFVKNLPFKCNNEELKEAFSVFGKIKDARIATKKNGISKCCGYVDFETEADAAKALQSEIEIGGRPITAFISNPPSKSEAKPQQRPRNADQKTALGSRSKPMSIPSAGRKMRIATDFVPRSVAISKKKPVTH